MRFPFQDPDRPGLAVFGDGRGHNQLVGEFTVRDIEYGADGTVISYAATFVQQGLNFDGTTDPPMRRHHPVQHEGWSQGRRARATTPTWTATSC